MKNAFTIALASALITTAAIRAAPALAQTAPAVETNVSLVRTADLDLKSDAGRRQLDLRLARAAREVCGTASDADVQGKNAVRECRDEVLASARKQRDSVLAATQNKGLIAVAAVAAAR